jgi:uncharacterized repeat protein (TIGR03843 family)
MTSRPEDDLCLEALKKGAITIQGQFIHGSNYTYLVEVIYQAQKYSAVYKPIRGEQPLWDFPKNSLAKREVAAYWVSETMSWRFVPPTTYRRQAPLGPGSLQMYIEHDPAYNYFNFSQEDKLRLKPVVLFDLILNNADRKGSHILFDVNHKLWLIDHGLCFHVDNKLRTVIWDFAGQPIPPDLINNVTLLLQDIQSKGPLYQKLLSLLKKSEINALSRRAFTLTQTSQFPFPAENRRPFPWPPV